MSDLIKLESSTQLAKLDSFKSVEDMLGLAQVLIDSKLVPFTLKTPAMVVTVIQQGRELGFGAVTSINNINNIQGKPTLSVHAISAKLLQKGIKFQTIKNFEPVKDSTGKVINYETTIEFYTPLEKPIKGEYYLTESVSFSWKEAVEMELTEKPNWIKMKRIMLWTRCFAIGARRVADDAILGLYETTEWCDTVGQDYNITEEGKVTILNN